MTDPKTDRLNKSRTLSCTRDSREGTASSTIPASKLLESGKGLRIFASSIMLLFAREYQNNQTIKSRREPISNTPSVKINRRQQTQRNTPTVQYNLTYMYPRTTSPASLPPYHFPSPSPSVNTSPRPQRSTAYTIRRHLQGQSLGPASMSHPAAQRGCHPTMRNAAACRLPSSSLAHQWPIESGSTLKRTSASHHARTRRVRCGRLFGGGA